MKEIPTKPGSAKPPLPSSLQKITEQLSKNRNLKPAEMRTILLEADVQPEELAPWADYEHPPEDSYGRKLVHKAGNYEIMVMSWLPGDFSTIHDHGFTQWGAVQVFGPAEHATFRLDNDRLSTLARWQMQAGDAVGVHHDLIHQMGNPGEAPFLSLHIYGGVEDLENVTGEARLFDVQHDRIVRVNGGVFFALPEGDYVGAEEKIESDFPTRLRHMVELIRRLQKMAATDSAYEEDLQEAIRDFISDRHLRQLKAFVGEISDEKGHITNGIAWRILFQELKAAARLQRELFSKERPDDKFHRYAQLYDAVIGQPCLDGFMGKYLQFFIEAFGVDLKHDRLLSIGCGTGLVEAFIIKELGLPREHLHGFDISKAMVEEAKARIPVREGDVLALDPARDGEWDIAYSGLNVFHYIPHEQLEKAIERTASVLRSGGYFVGDFITPDHIRWYPSVMISEDAQVVSLRNPALIERGGSMFQESEIFNVQAIDRRMSISYAGKHRRFLPPLHRVRGYFEKHFGGPVKLYDAYSLEELGPLADTSPSTRYVVVAQKA